jgi:hypothetical protein
MFKLSQYGYKVLDYTDSPRCDINNDTPYDSNLITLFIVKNPFSYCLKYHSQEHILTHGWYK